MESHIFFTTQRNISFKNITGIVHQCTLIKKDFFYFQSKICFKETLWPDNCGLGFEQRSVVNQTGCFFFFVCFLPLSTVQHLYRSHNMKVKKESAGTSEVEISEMVLHSLIQCLLTAQSHTAGKQDIPLGPRQCSTISDFSEMIPILHRLAYTNPNRIL